MCMYIHMYVNYACHLLPSMFKSNVLGILHTLLEMFSYQCILKTDSPGSALTWGRSLMCLYVCSTGQLLPSVFKSNAWGILHTLLEMFSYRLHHIQPHYRIQLLSQLHQLAQVQQMTQYQLHLWYDNSLVFSHRRHHSFLGIENQDQELGLGSAVDLITYDGLSCLHYGSDDSIGCRNSVVATLIGY